MDKPHWLLLELFELGQIQKVELCYQGNAFNNKDIFICVTDQKGKQVRASVSMMTQFLIFEPDWVSVARRKLSYENIVIEWYAENKKCSAIALVKLDNGVRHHVRCVGPECEGAKESEKLDVFYSWCHLIEKGGWKCYSNDMKNPNDKDYFVCGPCYDKE